MTLPPALAARLKKRGIIRQDPEVEVIAESYDDEKRTNQPEKLPIGPSFLPPPVEKKSLKEPYAPGCPNKYNPYHLCVEFCFDRWGDGVTEDNLEPEYDRRRLRMLRKYPLPSGWKEVYDPGLARHYYWNRETDDVSWLSPTHPRAVVGESAPKFAKAVFDKSAKDKKDAGAKSKRQKRRSPSPLLGTAPGLVESSSSSDEEVESTKKRKETTKRKKRSDLDPMDPASYSDVPRGKWSSGLDVRGEATTGADTTAVGPLFQMRPYPAPGAVLRRNAEITKRKQKKDSDEDEDSD